MIDHLSVTQISMFCRCSRQWEFRYLKGIILPPPGAVIQGAAYHRTLESYFKAKLNTGVDVSQARLDDWFAACWDAVLNERRDEHGESLAEEIDWEEQKPAQVKDQTALLLRAYHRDIASSVQPIAVESRLSCDIEGIRFVGVIDLETSESVIDHKVRGRAMSKDDAQGELQPCAYGLLTGQRRFAFHNALKTKQPSIQVVTLEKSQKELEWFTVLVKQVTQAILTGIFYPSPGGWQCSSKWCGYWNLCR